MKHFLDFYIKDISIPPGFIKLSIKLILNQMTDSNCLCVHLKKKKKNAQDTYQCTIWTGGLKEANYLFVVLKWPKCLQAQV